MRDDAAYRPLFRDAFPGEQDPVTLTNVVHVISTFVRTLVSFESPYDRFFRGDEAALGGEARRELDLFRSNEFKCARLQIRPISAGVLAPGWLAHRTSARVASSEAVTRRFRVIRRA